MNPVLKKGEKSRILKQPEIMWNVLNTYTLSCLWLQLYKREDLMGIEAFKTNLSYGEDYCINVEKHSKTRRLLAINDVLYCYCDNKDSITKNQNKEKIINRIKDRIVASQIVCNSLSEYSDSFRNKAVISQMKMIRNAMMELSRIKDYNQNELSSDFSELLSRNSALLDDSLKLALIKMKPIDKYKNKRIVEAIIGADCSYIYRYIGFWKRFLFIKKCMGGKRNVN